MSLSITGEQFYHVPRRYYYHYSQRELTSIELSFPLLEDILYLLKPEKAYMENPVRIFRSRGRHGEEQITRI
jgi:hypothetical protein